MELNLICSDYNPDLLGSGLVACWLREVRQTDLLYGLGDLRQPTRPVHVHDVRIGRMFVLRVLHG